MLTTLFASAATLLHLAFAGMAAEESASLRPPRWMAIYRSPLMCAGVSDGIEYVEEGDCCTSGYALVLRVDHRIKGTLPNIVRIHIPSTWFEHFDTSPDEVSRFVSGKRYVCLFERDEECANGCFRFRDYGEPFLQEMMIPAGARPEERVGIPEDNSDDEFELEFLSGIDSSDKSVLRSWYLIGNFDWPKSERCKSIIRDLQQSGQMFVIRTQNADSLTARTNATSSIPETRLPHFMSGEEWFESCPLIVAGRFVSLGRRSPDSASYPFVLVFKVDHILKGHLDESELRVVYRTDGDPIAPDEYRDKVFPFWTTSRSVVCLAGEPGDDGLYRTYWPEAPQVWRDVQQLTSTDPPKGVCKHQWKECLLDEYLHALDIAPSLGPDDEKRGFLVYMVLMRLGDLEYDLDRIRKNVEPLLTSESKYVRFGASRLLQPSPYDEQ